MKRTPALDLQGTGASQANIRAKISVSSWLNLRFNFPGISLRYIPFSSGSRSSSGVARKSTDVLSPRWKRHNIPVAVSKWNLSITLPHWPIRHLLINEFLVSLSLRLVVFSTLYCYINVRFLKYFLHNSYLVWFCDNPLLLYVWEEAKIWTQGTLHALLSHFCSIVRPTSIIGESALLCYGRHL